jgi:hypothetical protein
MLACHRRIGCREIWWTAMASPRPHGIKTQPLTADITGGRDAVAGCISERTN